ncbi:hypothetical protein BH23VER1_BH23VER1_13110 [soil metagenome]
MPRPGRDRARRRGSRCPGPRLRIPERIVDGTNRERIVDTRFSRARIVDANRGARIVDTHFSRESWTPTSQGESFSRRIVCESWTPTSRRRNLWVSDSVSRGVSKAQSVGVLFGVTVLPALFESRQREEAFAMLAELWTRKDPVVVSEWLAGLPPSPSRDRAVGRFATLIAPATPPTPPTGPPHRRPGAPRPHPRRRRQRVARIRYRRRLARKPRVPRGRGQSVNFGLRSLDRRFPLAERAGNVGCSRPTAPRASRQVRGEVGRGRRCGDPPGRQCPSMRSALGCDVVRALRRGQSPPPPASAAGSLKNPKRKQGRNRFLPGFGAGIRLSDDPRQFSLISSYWRETGGLIGGRAARARRGPPSHRHQGPKPMTRSRTRTRKSPSRQALGW